MSPAEGLSRLGRRVLLVAAAVGAGFVVAALFGGPAAASGSDRGGSDAGRHQLARVEVGGGVRLALAERPAGHRADPGSTGGLPESRRSGLLRGVVGDLAVPSGRTSATGGRSAGHRSAGVLPERASVERSSRGGVAPYRPDAGRGLPGRPVRPLEERARAERAPDLLADPVRRAVDRRDPAAVASTAPPTVPAVRSVADRAAAPLAEVVLVVPTGLVRSATAMLPRLADTVLSPVLGTVGAVTAPVIPLLPASPATPPANRSPSPEPNGGRVTDPLVDPVRIPSARSRGPMPLTPAPDAGPALAVPPPWASALRPAKQAASVNHPVVRQGPGPQPSGGTGRPVLPGDARAASTHDGSGSGPGSTGATVRPSRHDGSHLPDLSPARLEGRSAAVAARPG